MNPKIFVFNETIIISSSDAGAKKDFTSVILSKSEVNQFVVFVQAFMQRWVNSKYEIDTSIQIVFFVL